MMHVPFSWGLPFFLDVAGPRVSDGWDGCR